MLIVLLCDVVIFLHSISQLSYSYFTMIFKFVEHHMKNQQQLCLTANKSVHLLSETLRPSRLCV